MPARSVWARAVIEMAICGGIGAGFAVAGMLVSLGWRETFLIFAGR